MAELARLPLIVLSHKSSGSISPKTVSPVLGDPKLLIQPHAIHRAFLAVGLPENAYIVCDSDLISCLLGVSAPYACRLEAQKCGLNYLVPLSAMMVGPALARLQHDCSGHENKSPYSLVF